MTDVAFLPHTAKVPHRLTLFYVCNDIVQNSRRKKIPDLVQHFATAIKEAAPLVRYVKQEDVCTCLLG